MSKKQNQTLRELVRVKYEDYLKVKAGHYNDPPIRDGRCDCCGKHITEFKPFGELGDPLDVDFTGEMLVKTSRPLEPYVDEVGKAFEKAEKCFKEDGFDDIEDWLIDKYGMRKATRMDCVAQAYNQVGSSWECRDCGPAYG